MASCPRSRRYVLPAPVGEQADIETADVHPAFNSSLGSKWLSGYGESGFTLEQAGEWVLFFTTHGLVSIRCSDHYDQIVTTCHTCTSRPLPECFQHFGSSQAATAPRPTTRTSGLCGGARLALSLILKDPPNVSHSDQQSLSTADRALSLPIGTLLDRLLLEPWISIMEYLPPLSPTPYSILTSTYSSFTVLPSGRSVLGDFIGSAVEEIAEHDCDPPNLPKDAFLYIEHALFLSAHDTPSEDTIPIEITDLVVRTTNPTTRILTARPKGGYPHRSLVVTSLNLRFVLWAGCSCGSPHGVCQGCWNICYAIKYGCKFRRILRYDRLAERAQGLAPNQIEALSRFLTAEPNMMLHMPHLLAEISRIKVLTPPFQVQLSAQTFDFVRILVETRNFSIAVKLLVKVMELGGSEQFLAEQSVALGQLLANLPFDEHLPQLDDLFFSRDVDFQCCYSYWQYIFYSTPRANRPAVILDKLQLVLTETMWKLSVQSICMNFKHSPESRTSWLETVLCFCSRGSIWAISAGTQWLLHQSHVNERRIGRNLADSAARVVAEELTAAQWTFPKDALEVVTFYERTSELPTEVLLLVVRQLVILGFPGLHSYTQQILSFDDNMIGCLLPDIVERDAMDKAVSARIARLLEPEDAFSEFYTAELLKLMIQLVKKNPYSPFLRGMFAEIPIAKLKVSLEVAKRNPRSAGVAKFNRSYMFLSEPESDPNSPRHERLAKRWDIPLQHQTDLTNALQTWATKGEETLNWVEQLYNLVPTWQTLYSHAAWPLVKPWLLASFVNGPRKSRLFFPSQESFAAINFSVHDLGGGAVDVATALRHSLRTHGHCVQAASYLPVLLKQYQDEAVHFTPKAEAFQGRKQMCKMFEAAVFVALPLMREELSSPLCQQALTSIVKLASSFDRRLGAYLEKLLSLQTQLVEYVFCGHKNCRGCTENYGGFIGLLGTLKLHCFCTQRDSEWRAYIDGRVSASAGTIYAINEIKSQLIAPPKTKRQELTFFREFLRRSE